MNEQATERAVRSALLDWLPYQANRKEHTVIVFFAGHGVVYHGNAMLLVRDTDATMLGGSSVPMDVVERAFNMIEAERKLFFVDACHSGAVREVALAAQAERDRVAQELAAERERIATAQAQAEAERARQEALRLQQELEVLLKQQQEQAMPTPPACHSVGERVREWERGRKAENQSLAKAQRKARTGMKSGWIRD